MSKMTNKVNKKEERKKMMVRIVCMVLVVALAVTSLLAMFPTLFQSTDPELQALIDAGYVYLGEDGEYHVTDAYIEAMISAATPEDGEPAETEDHTGHDHE